MPIPSLIRRAAGAMAMLLGLMPRPAAAQAQDSSTTSIRVGVVLDGPSTSADSARVALQAEVEGSLGTNLQVDFPADLRLVGDWTAPGATAAIDRLMADPRVDLVLALGTIGSQELARRTTVAKPSIAATVLDAAAQRLPLVDGASGVHDLTYIDPGLSLTRTFDILHRAVPYRHLALLMDAGIAESMPFLADELRRAAGADVTVSLVPLDGPASAAWAAIPTDADALAIGPADRLGPGALDSLIASAAERRLLTFSLAGRAGVERGALASYGGVDDAVRRARRVASAIQRIVGGEDAGNLPVGLVCSARLTLNMATARAIGFSPAWEVLTEADQVDCCAEGTGPVWSLASVGREALASNLDIRAAQQGVSTGRQDVRSTRAALLPQLQAEATGTLTKRTTAAASLGQRAERESQGRLMLSQTLFDDQTWAAFRVADYGHQGRIAERKRTELDAVLRATTAYLSVLRAQALARVERENLALTRSNLDVAQLKEGVGSAGMSDVYRWQAELAQSRRRVLAADAGVQVAALELNSALNRPLEEAFTTADAGVDDPTLLVGDPRTLDYLDTPARLALFRDFAVREGLAASPELEALDLQIRAEDRRGTSARRSFFLPTIYLQGGMSSLVSRGGAGSTPPDLGGLAVPRGPDDTWSVQLKASLPLFSGSRRRAQVARSDSELERLTTVREAAALAVAQRIRAAVQIVGASWADIAQARLAAEAARSNLELVTDAYGRGAVNVLSLLDAQQAAHEANEAAANAVYDFLIDLMKAQRAVGVFDFTHTPEQREEFYRRLDAFLGNAGRSSPER